MLWQKKKKCINSEILSYFELILIILVIQILLIMQVKRVFQIYILSEYFYNILFLTGAKMFVFLTTPQCKEKDSVALEYQTAFGNSINELFHIALKRAAFPTFPNTLSGQIQAARSWWNFVIFRHKWIRVHHFPSYTFVDAVYWRPVFRS